METCAALIFFEQQGIIHGLQLQLPQSVHRLYTDRVPSVRMSEEMTEGRINRSRPQILFEAL